MDFVHPLFVNSLLYACVDGKVYTGEAYSMADWRSCSEVNKKDNRGHIKKKCADMIRFKYL